MIPEQLSPSSPYVADVVFQAGDIVFAADRAGCVVYWNTEAEAVTGYKAAEVLGKPFAVACRMEPHPDIDLAGILAGRDFAGGIRCQSRSGVGVALYLFATAGRDAAGEPAGVVFVARDVTGLWQAEEAAQASADKYRVLFESIADAVTIAAMDGQVLEANPAFLRLYGYTARDVGTANLMGLVAAEDRNAAAKALAGLSQGRAVAKTLRARRRDGTAFVVDFAASVMSVAGERRILAVARDVTGRVRAEQARNQSEQLYRTVFESANDAVFIESVDGRILDANRNGCELLGYRRDELTKMNVSDLVPAEARAWLPRVTDAILRDGTFRSEAVRVHRDGHQIPVEISASTMELDGRTVVLAIVRDITERRLAEQALRESEEKFRSVAEQSPNMIFINSRGRVAYANQKSADMMGYTREEFYSPEFNFMRLIAPESAGQIQAVYARHTRGEEVEPYEYTLVTKDGRRINSIITTKLIDYEGAKAILGIVTDITTRKATEEALREEKEMSQTYLALAGAMLVALDTTGGITLINRRACHVLGVAEAEALGRNWFDNYVPERSRAQVKTAFAALMEGNLEPVEHYTNPVLTSGGEERLIVWHNALLRDPQGRLTGSLSSGEDVTEREKVLQALRESEEKYRNVVELASDGICVVQDGRLKYVNPRLAQMVGLGVEELTGRTFIEFVHPDDKETVVYRYRRRLAGEEMPAAYRVRFLPRGGGEVSVEANVRLASYGGSPAEIVLVRDVTERERSAQAARESDENFRNLAASIRDGVATVDTQGCFTFVNEVTAQRSGRPLDWWLGRHHLDAVPPDQRERQERILAAVLRGERLDPYDFSYLTADGRTVYIEATAAPLRKNGKVVGAVAVNRDVTERKAAEQALRESEDNFRALAENATDGVTIGDEDGRHVFANRRAAEILGYSVEELLQMTFRDLVPPGERQLLEERFARRSRGEEVPSHYDLTIVRRDGGAVPVEVGVSRTRWRGRPAQMVMLHDISGRQRVEQTLAASEERYRGVVESSPDGMVVVQNEVVVLANRATADMLGYGEPAELIGLRGTSLISSEDLPRVSELGELLKTGSATFGPMMVRLVTRGGQALPAEVVGASTSWRGKRATQVMIRPLAGRQV